MKRMDDRWELSAVEMRWTQCSAGVAAILLAGFTQAVLVRFLRVAPPVAFSISFLALSVPLYIPLKADKARRNVELTLARYTMGSITGAAIAGAVAYAFGM